MVKEEKLTAGPMMRFDPFPGSRAAKSGPAGAWGPRRTRAQEAARGSRIISTAIVCAVVALAVIGAFWSAGQ